MPQSNSKVKNSFRPRASVFRASLVAQNMIAERIPTELLCKIFHGTFPHSRDADFGDTIVTVPWKLGFVCQCWRESALGDPSLWSSIEIQCRWRSAAQLAAYYPLAALQTQILRSGDIPLEITFGCGSHANGEVPSSHFLALLETVVRESHRWRKLDLDWEIDHSAALLILAQIKGRLPQLHRLKIDGTLLPSALFEVAPQLRSVSSFRYETKPLSVPWPQITHFRGKSTAQVCLDICTLAPQLVDCAFTTPDASDATPPGTPGALLPQLRRLAVFGSSLLPFLDAPNLEYLFIDTLASAIPFLLRSRCRLKGIGASYCSSPDLIQLVPHIPTLLHFQADFPWAVEAPHATHQLFRVLLDTCPNLVSLHVTFGHPPFPYDALYNLIVARQRTLTFVCLQERHGIIPSDVKQRFGALRSDSLEVILYDNDSPALAWTRVATEDMQALEF
ncbi:hypothetical protein C8R46DRAFT_1270853 [Mycena filopes]|nr:hypothetical protein C8R46DRAFT_1270853 [Mycena filopes]